MALSPEPGLLSPALRVPSPVCAIVLIKGNQGAKVVDLKQALVIALCAFHLTDVDMIAVALATIRAESEGFVPIAEMVSQFNTLG